MQGCVHLRLCNMLDLSSYHEIKCIVIFYHVSKYIYKETERCHKSVQLKCQKSIADKNHLSVLYVEILATSDLLLICWVTSAGEDIMAEISGSPSPK